MSYTALYGIKEKRRTVFIDEYKNSHGFGTVIWDCYFKKYLNEGSKPQLFSNRNYDDLWKLPNDNRLPDHHKAILIATYDYSIIRKNNIDDFIGHLELWQKDFGEDLDEKCIINHVPNILKTLRENRRIIDKFDSIGIQVTSIGDDQYDIGWGKIRKRGVSPEKLYSVYK